MAILSVNIDHVATVRQARRTWEPDPAEAAIAAQQGGAGGITVHLREDRRHIQDTDLPRIQEVLEVPFNFEMAATDEMVSIAIQIRPHSAMLVPEGRQEITTEGGLDVVGQRPRLRDIVQQLDDAGIPTSAFIDPDDDQIDAAAECGFHVCEIHTGPWAEAVGRHGPTDSEEALAQRALVAQAGRRVINAGMRFNAGHALNYLNTMPIAALDGLCELHIGHSIVSRSIHVGMEQAVRDMTTLIKQATS